MKVLIVGDARQQQEISSKKTNPGAELIFSKSIEESESYNEYDAIFHLSEYSNRIEAEKFAGKPVFINSVIETLEQKKLPLNFSRVNGWPGFLQGHTWEVASNDETMARTVFENLHWHFVIIKDQPGLVAPRVISMIINEAFFALDEGISTIGEIDLAMKLGTNYPNGPFEWLNKIGIQNIYHLLNRLSQEDERYSVSPLLEKKYFEITSPQLT